MRTPISLRRMDSRFLLPEWPRSVDVVGEVPGWHEGLAVTQMERADPDVRADLVVAQAADAAAAAQGGPTSLLLFGRASRGSWSAGYASERQLALPDTVDPRALVPRAHRRAAGYVFSSWLPGSSRRSRARNRVAAGAARAGCLAPVLPEILLATRRPGPPAMVQAAVRAGLLGPTVRSQWFLGRESGADSKRLALFVFPDGSPRPVHLLKFERRPGPSDCTRREAAGLELLAATGGAAAMPAPRLVGRFDFHGHEILVETARPGITLSRLLVGPSGRAAKVAVLEQVVAWLRQVARETVRLAGDDGTETGHSLRHVPRVFGHGDLAPGNILVTEDDFSVVDWELARSRSFPLWDMLYFALYSLPLLDGQGEDPPDDYLVRLFSGAAPSSELLFTWVQCLREDLSLSEQDVSALAASLWLHWVDQVRELTAESAGEPLSLPTSVERIARLWTRHAAFRADWPAWRATATAAKST